MAYAARAVAGNSYYADMLVFGPAGSLWINEVFYRLAGATELSIYLMGCTFAVLTLAGVFRCASLLTDVRGGLIAAVAFTLLNADLFHRGEPAQRRSVHQCLPRVGVRPRARSACSAVTIAPRHGGALFFLASSIKHFVVLTPVVGGGRDSSRSDAEGWRRQQHRIHPASASGRSFSERPLGMWAALLGWYGVTHRLPAVLDALTDRRSPTQRKQQGFLASLVTGLHPFALIPPHQLPFVLLYVLLMAALIAASSADATHAGRWSSGGCWGRGRRSRCPGASTLTTTCCGCH
jgi:hypothetical protein